MNVVGIILIVIICICGVVLILFKIKNRITYKHHMMLAEAIYSYQLYCVGKRRILEVDYEYIEKYEKTLFRWWDWGYTRIMPKYAFEIIEPFIKKDK